MSIVRAWFALARSDMRGFQAERVQGRPDRFPKLAFSSFWQMAT